MFFVVLVGRVLFCLVCLFVVCLFVFNGNQFWRKYTDPKIKAVIHDMEAASVWCDWRWDTLNGERTYSEASHLQEEKQVKFKKILNSISLSLADNPSNCWIPSSYSWWILAEHRGSPRAHLRKRETGQGWALLVPEQLTQGCSWDVSYFGSLWRPVYTTMTCVGCKWTGVLQ